MEKEISNLVLMFGNLLAESEKRIDATNKMVFSQTGAVRKIENCIEMLTRVYNERFEKLAKNRDELFAECKKLHEELIAMQNEKDRMHQQYVNLVEKIIYFRQTNGSENNFNITR